MSNDFKKYPSIENTYREKEINNWLKYHPHLQTERFILTEKIHGCNFQWFITQNNIQFGKRTSLLAEDESFYDYQNVMKKYDKEINKFQNYIKENNLENIRVFGEFFGSNIQKGVKYGEEKRFRIFDIYINNELLPQINTINLLTKLDIKYMFVPIVDIVDGLENALNYNIEFNSNLYDTEERNICEGIVIKPYNITYLNGDSPFYLKKKNKEFSEKQHQSKVFIKDEELENVRNVFKQYLTENRIENVMSKYGLITSTKEIGNYIKYVLEDAREDFLKDNKELFLSLDDKKKKQVFGITGSVIVPILNKYL